MIKCVIFDIDNTLYSYDRCSVPADAALISYAEGIYPEKNEIRADIREMLELVKERCPGQAVTHNRLVRAQLMLEKRGIPSVPHAARMAEAYWEALISAMEAEEGLMEFLKLLRDRGIRIGYGSNMTAYIQLRKLEKLGLGTFTDFVVTSEEAGCEKPDPRLFELCIRKAGCLPEECLFIGDSAEMDVYPALASGMRALLYLKNSPELKASAPAELASFVSYTELLEDNSQTILCE